MPNTFFGLTIAKSGLYASMTGINATAHNISNAETEGYSRQVANSQATKALYAGNSTGMIGTGVDVIGVERVRSEYYDVKYRTNNTTFGEYNTKNYYLREVENYFNEIKLEGFTTTFDNMYDTLQELQKHPTDLTVRTQMTNYSQAFCEYFNYIYSSVQNVQKEVNSEIYNEVSKINSIGEQVAQLTKQINTLEVKGAMASDLRDQRDLLIDELSRMVDVDVKEIPVGQTVGINSYNVRINGQLLVDTYNSNQLECVPRTSKLTQNDAIGLYDIVWKQDGQAFNLGEATTTGSLKALYDVMDGNDGQAFKGMASGNQGDTVLTLTSDFSYVNDARTLTLDQTGEITLGNRKYHYNGFSVSEGDDGKYVYEFSLDKPLLVDADKVLPATEAVSGFQFNAVIGRDINYKGIPFYLAQLNEFVRTFSEAYNNVFTSGVDLNGNKGLDFFNTTQPVSGKNYAFVDNWSAYGEDESVLFTSKTGSYAIEEDENNYGSYYFMTAGNFAVNYTVANDPKLVAAASSIVNGKENSDIAKQLLALKTDSTMFKQGAPSQYLQTVVSEIGIYCEKARQFADNQEDILSTISNQRLSISGVDQDEETMDLVRYQNMYNLNAKVVSIMNEIYSKLINEMGV